MLGLNLSKKCIFGQKWKEVNITIEFCIFELVWVPNFSLNWKCWFFRPKFAQKVYFQSKGEKVNITI